MDTESSLALTFPIENAARAVRGQVPTPGYPSPSAPTSLGTQPPKYLPP